MSGDAPVVEVRTRWWLPLYVRGVIWCVLLLRREPNMERVNWWLQRGVYTRERH